MRNSKRVGLGAHSPKILLLSLLLLALACGPDIDERLGRAADMLAQKRFSEARVEYEKLVKQLSERGKKEERPKLAQALFSLGEINQNYLSDPEAAVLHYKRVAKEFPSSDKAFESQARVVRIYSDVLDDLPRAATEGRALVQNFPFHKSTDEYYLLLLKVYLRQKDLKQVIADGKIFLTRHVRSAYAADVHYVLGNAYYFDGQAEEAIGHYNQAIEGEVGRETKALSQFELAQIYEEKKELARALALNLAALEGHPNQTVVREKISELQKLLEQQGNDKELMGLTGRSLPDPRKVKAKIKKRRRR